jgi:ABC-2 type transport system ATP-binding protein
MTAAVHVQDLVKKYKDMPRNAVDQLSFDIPAEAVVGLLGPNGAGKSTLIKLLCGATLPDSGAVEVFGSDPAANGGRAKQDIGVVHQTGPFDMMLPALDNLRIAAKFKGLRWRDVRPWVDGLISAFGLEHNLSQLTFSLSGGELRRLQVIRALLGSPPLLLLDEPSAGLDVGGRREVWSLLDTLRRENGTTVVWTSHYVEELERNCQQVIILNRGRLVDFAAPRDLAERCGGRAALLRPSDPAKTLRLAALLDQPDLRIHVNADWVEVTCRDVRGRLPALLADAEAHGIGVDSVEYRAPSLEDAFMELVGAANDH